MKNNINNKIKNAFRKTPSNNQNYIDNRMKDSFGKIPSNNNQNYIDNRMKEAFGKIPSNNQNYIDNRMKEAFGKIPSNNNQNSVDNRVKDSFGKIPSNNNQNYIDNRMKEAFEKMSSNNNQSSVDNRMKEAFGEMPSNNKISKPINNTSNKNDSVNFKNVIKNNKNDSLNFKNVIKKLPTSPNAKPWYKKKASIIAMSSTLGVGILATAIAVPIVLLSVNRVAGDSVIDIPYNESIPLVSDNPNFKAYYVDKWKNMFFTEVNINLSKGASNSIDEINLQNLANIGIVPTNDNWKNWQRVRSAPILNKSDQFQIIIQTHIIDTIVDSYPVVLANGAPAIKPSTRYNATISYYNDSNFIAYKPNSFTTISDFYLTYTKNSQDGNGITIENLERIGIVPIFDAYKTWTQITLFPINATTVKVTINTGNANATKNYNITNLPPSTLYDSTTSIYIAADGSFVAYTPNLVKENFLVDLSIEYTKSNSNPNLSINYNNLAKIGIVPLSNEYKLWESIILQPINSNQVKIIVNASASKSFDYIVTGVKKSTFYDDSQIIYSNNSNFIMYLPNNWKNLYPLEGKLTLTNTSSDPNTKISLATLEKIGIVPITSDYLTWTSIDITPIGSGTCTIAIKKGTTNVAEITATNRFKTSGTYGTTILHQELSNVNYNFIWYRPTAWNNTLSVYDVDLFLWDQVSITLDSLEAVGIVPLNDTYKSWASVIVSTNQQDGLKGILYGDIRSTTSGVSPLPRITITGFKIG